MADVAGVLSVLRVSVRSARVWSQGDLAVSVWEVDRTDLEAAVVRQRLPGGGGGGGGPAGGASARRTRRSGCCPDATGGSSRRSGCTTACRERRPSSRSAWTTDRGPFTWCVRRW